MVSQTENGTDQLGSTQVLYIRAGRCYPRCQDFYIRSLDKPLNVVHDGRCFAATLGPLCPSKMSRFKQISGS